MSELDVPIVVYHVATMGNWHEVIREQFLLLRECGLSQALADIGDAVRITHVGQHLDIVLEEAARQDIPVRIIRSDPNTDHYETFAMIEIDRLAKEEQVKRHILYFHTKGVSAPHLPTKRPWRKAMEYHVLTKWCENVRILSEHNHDAVGLNWISGGEQHFSGTFWMAKADWIRRLPNFVEYHHAKGLVRYSCEMWIGAQQWCNAYSQGTRDQPFWYGEYDFSYLFPAPQASPAITWITAVTPKYVGILNRLQASFGLLGPGHQLLVSHVEQSVWHGNAFKLQEMRRLLPSITNSHVFWIDADCAFLCPLLPTDFMGAGKPLTVVRHFAFDDPRVPLPECHHYLLPDPVPQIYFQSCLFGGEKEALRDLLERVRWIDFDPRPYDEHALNIEWLHSLDQLYILPPRYAAPEHWTNMPPEYVERYHERAGGVPRISHQNTEILHR